MFLLTVLLSWIFSRIFRPFHFRNTRDIGVLMRYVKEVLIEGNAFRSTSRSDLISVNLGDVPYAWIFSKWLDGTQTRPTRVQAIPFFNFNIIKNIVHVCLHLSSIITTIILRNDYNFVDRVLWKFCKVILTILVVASQSRTILKCCFLVQ